MLAKPTFHNEAIEQTLKNLERQFFLSEEALLLITKAFLEEVSTGLREYNHPMAMIPSFVTAVPDGTETGSYLAVDLGGTNLRVCEVTLNGDQTYSLRQQKYKVSDALKTGEASVLFDYLADSVDAFLTESDSASVGVTAQTATTSSHADGNVQLGLTFSFPVEQAALDSGVLLTWTKGFSARNAVGKDVVQLLQHAFDRKHMHVTCSALVNDTVGALLSRAYSAGGCMLGAIFGTGTNGAYFEEISNIPKLANNPAHALGGSMIVNTEWGAFNNSRTALPSTSFDNKLDRESINPGFQAFEKFISGMYLGEIARNVILGLIDAAPKAILFRGKSTKLLNTHYGFDTAVMSAVEEAWELDANPEEVTESAELSSETWEADLSPTRRSRLERVRQVLIKEINFTEDQVSLRDASIVRRVVTMVASRAAALSACAVATILVQTRRAAIGGEKLERPREEEQKIIIGVDGSLIQFYPNFELTLRKSLATLVGKEVEHRVDIGLAKDGSGVGAALGAYIASKQDAVKDALPQK